MHGARANGPPADAARPYLWMLLGAMSFAAMSTLVSAVGDRCDWQLIAIIRTFLAMVFAAGLAVSSGAKLVFIRPPVLWMRSLAGSMSLVLNFYSLTRLPTTEVLTLTNMFPIWVALLSWPLLGLRPERGLWLAVICGICGVALMQQPELSRGNYYWVAALASSLFSALALIGLHKLSFIDPRAVVTHFSAVALLVCIATWFLFPHRSTSVTLDSVLLVQLLGVGVTATIGQIFLTKAFATGHPGRVSVIGLSQVGFGMLLELIFVGRDYNAVTLAGIVLVLIPTAWVLLRHARRNRVP